MNMYLCATKGNCIKTFSLTNDCIQLQQSYTSSFGDILCAQYNHNGKLIASCTSKGTICLYNTISDTLVSHFQSPSRSSISTCINSIRFSSGSRFLASAGTDGIAKIWDLKTQECTQEYDLGRSPATSVTFSGLRDNYLAIGYKSGSISIYDVTKSERLRVYKPEFDVGHPSAVTTLQASPHPHTREVLGAAYSDGSVRLWDVQSEESYREFVKQHQGVVTSIALSPVSKVLFMSGGLDGKVVFYDSQQCQYLRSLYLGVPISSLALCNDGKTLAIGTVRGDVVIYDLRGDIKPMYSFQCGHDIPCRDIVDNYDHDLVSNHEVHLQGLRNSEWIRSLHFADKMQTTSPPPLHSSSERRTSPLSPNIDELQPASPVDSCKSNSSPTHMTSLNKVVEKNAYLTEMDFIPPSTKGEIPTSIRVTPVATMGNTLHEKWSEILQKNKLQHDEMSSFVKGLLDQVAKLSKENLELRKENEVLKDHIIALQTVSKTDLEDTNDNSRNLNICYH